MDLDDFKMVNDTLGHPAGDELLNLVAERIVGCVRDGDTVARLGGDEFAVLLEGRDDRSQLIAHRVVEAFERPFVLNGQELLVRPSVGLAVAEPDDPDVTAVELLKRADVAMYAAKRSRTGGVHTFNTEMLLAEAPTANCSIAPLAAAGPRSRSGPAARRTAPGHRQVRTDPGLPAQVRPADRQRSPESRHWCAGHIPSAVCSHRTSSCRWCAGTA